MKKYEIGFGYQNGTYAFVYQHDMKGFPDPEQILLLVMIEAEKLHDSTKPLTEVELLSISRIG